MNDRRLVGIDLGIISAHTVRVLGGDGSVVCRRKAVSTVASLTEVEQTALAGADAGGEFAVPDHRAGEAAPRAVNRVGRGWRRSARPGAA
jgi:hypothetical protein